MEKVVKVNGAPIIYLIWQALFEHPLPKSVKIGNKHYQIKHFGGAQGNLPGVDIGNTRVVVQNPATNSKWAKMAREGAKIAWAINKLNTGDKWLGRIVDGRCYKPVMEGIVKTWVEITWPGHKEGGTDGRLPM